MRPLIILHVYEIWEDNNHNTFFLFLYIWCIPIIWYCLEIDASIYLYKARYINSMCHPHN